MSSSGADSRIRSAEHRTALRTRPSRVLIIVQNLSVPFDRRVWLECQALRNDGYDVSVICPTGHDAERRHEILEGVRIHRYKAPSPARGLLGFAREFSYCWLRAAFLSVADYRRSRFEVVQACNPPDTYFALAFGWKLLGVRFVFDQHDLCPELYSSRFERPSRVLLASLRLLERATYAVADEVIVTNESYREVALDRGSLGSERVTVVRTGPDPGRLQPRAPVPELKNGRRYLCCYLGVMGPQDGVDLLVRAIHFVVKELGREDCQFTLMGFGDCLADVRALTSELGLNEWVELTGKADDETIARYLSSADVGLCPDPKNPLNDLSTHNKTMEYMAFGLPVVAFDLRETRVSARHAAVYAKPNDVREFGRSIVALLDDPDRRAAMAREGRERVENVLSWRHQAPRYVEVMRRAIHGALRGRTASEPRPYQTG